MQEMKKKAIISVIIFVALSLIIWRYYKSTYDNKENHEFSKEIRHGIYEEVFLLSSGGGLATDSYSCYLTDSLSFRKFVGKFDNKEKYLINPVGIDSIKVVKYSWRIHYGIATPIDSALFSIKELKKEGDFE
jgi:hypothetical protein